MLTKSQKNHFIESLYRPMFDYIEGIIEQPDNQVSFWDRVMGRKPVKRARITADNLRAAAYYGYQSKAKFESRVMTILDAFLEGKVDGNKLPASEPVMTEEEEVQRKERVKAQTLKDLREFQWADLKSEDDRVAHRAIWVHDWIKASCAVYPETKQAYLQARADAGWNEGEI